MRLSQFRAIDNILCEYHLYVLSTLLTIYCVNIIFRFFRCYVCYFLFFRYCLDGPVVFTDEIIWYCEDCEIEVIDVDFSDNAIVDSENTEVSFSDYCDQNSGDSENVEVEDCDGEVIDVDNSDKEIADLENVEVEDCEVEVVDVDSSDKEIADSKNTEVNSVEDCDQETADSVKVEVDSGYECATVADSQPIADPIWRGSLQLINKSFELMAHLSTLASPKVHEVTRHFPNVLYADLLQRSAVWPNLFRKFGAYNEDIGLYFLPQNERVERFFDDLVYEMISSDLAIRAEVEEAELLIFSSTTLPSEHRRFQSKYYLWGAVRKNKHHPKC
ncbi:uncharacterized protein LOC131623078 [Vicia villosa]|uniref:uncharacterized protein LOC131623078 n=1 Tax=Vicia villosa TaxID=3911 RepID=UPI00273C8955|nr:uncharacterized protein LOC131623078 [Vicia villosa]